MTAVITVTSGSRECGKSLLSANLAQYLTRRGHQTAVLAAGSRHAMWGVSPASTWPNVIAGRIPLEQIIHRDIFGVDMIVAHGHGHALGQFPGQSNTYMTEGLANLESYAYLIVDMAGGAAGAGMACCMASSETILVLPANTPALTAAYTWLSSLAKHGFNNPVNLVLNQVRMPSQTQSAYIRFRDLVHNRLSLKTNLWGSIAYEPSADQPEALRRPLTDLIPQSKIVKDIQSVGDRLLAEQPPENQTVQLGEFWRQFNHHLEQLPRVPIQPIGKPDDATNTDDFEVLAQSGAPPLSESEPTTLMNLNNTLSDIFEELRAIRRLLESRRGK